MILMRIAASTLLMLLALAGCGKPSFLDLILVLF